MEKQYLVIDVGGTAIKYVIMTETLSIADRGEVKTTYEGLDAYINALVGIYEIFKGRVSGIALSVPGIVDSDKGISVTGGALTFVNDVPIASILRERCNIPVSIENDAKCAALAEAWSGSLKDCKDGIVVLFGTGVGGGIIKDGKVHKGTHFSAGELSFMLMDDIYECKENMWGRQSGNRRLLTMVGNIKKINPDELNGHKIFEMANAGDKDVLKVLDQFTMLIAKMILNLQAIYDPEVVAIGGGISKQDLFIDMICENLDYLYNIHPLPIPRAVIERCHYFNDANLIGALRHYLTSMDECI